MQIHRHYAHKFELDFARVAGAVRVMTCSKGRAHLFVNSVGILMAELGWGVREARSRVCVCVFASSHWAVFDQTIVLIHVPVRLDFVKFNVPLSHALLVRG